MSGGGKNRKGGLSGEDEALWGWVARSVAPDRGKPRVVARDASEAEWPPRDAEPQPKSRRAASAPLPAARKPATPAAPPPRPAPPPQPQPVVLERRKARRIARGTEAIEARLDLHGMTQDDAHHALVGFVRRCQASGMRTVLVITGKGGSSARDEDDGVVPRPRGVLRRNVPRWLAGPEIGAMVISWSSAHLRHGGEGALYVRLRRRD